MVFLGLISLDKNLTDTDYLTVKMSDSISHRGPDQQKIKKFEKIILANNRLKKIMDLNDRSSLPMSSDDGSVWICYNGEVSNFIELNNKYNLSEKYNF